VLFGPRVGFSGTAKLMVQLSNFKNPRWRYTRTAVAHNPCISWAFLYRCLAQSSADSSSTCSVTIQHVIDACNKQKTGKAAGPDGIAMKAFMHGGLRLQLHLTLLINMFLHTGYLPHSFMQSIIIPLVKSKTGDLADPNNYRAILFPPPCQK